MYKVKKVNISIFYPCFKQPHEFLIKRSLNTSQITKEEFNKYYKLIYEFEEKEMTDRNEFLEDLFAKFNLDDGNPLGTVELQTKINQLQTHTNMSIGDVIKIDEKYYMVSGMGFHEANF